MTVLSEDSRRLVTTALFCVNEFTTQRRVKMLSKSLKTLEVRSREQWREWHTKHFDSESEVWLVFHKRQTGLPSIAYDDALDEALCFGWIDSLVKRLDDDRYARK